MDLHANNWQLPSLILLLPLPWCKHPNIWCIQKLGRQMLNLYSERLQEFQFIYRELWILLKFSLSAPRWQHSNKPDAATNGTHESKAFTHAQAFDGQDFNCVLSSVSYIHHQIISPSLAAFAVFPQNWGTFFYKQTGRLDLNHNKTLLKKGIRVPSMRKNIGEIDLSHERGSFLPKPFI